MEPSRRWWRHALVLAALVAVLGPVALLDRRLLSPGHGDWISFDLRGWLIAAYSVWLVVDAAITTVAVASSRLRLIPIRKIHQAGAVASLILIGIFGKALTLLTHSMNRSGERESEARALALSNAVVLDRWSVQESAHPGAAWLTLVCTKDGAVGADIHGVTRDRQDVLLGEVERQPIHAGDRVDLRVPLRPQGIGDVVQWNIYVRFDEGKPPEGVAYHGTLYEPSPPPRAYTGYLVRRPLPPRSPRPADAPPDADP